MVQSDGDVVIVLEAILTPGWVPTSFYATLDGLGGTGVTHIHNIIDMVT